MIEQGAPQLILRAPASARAGERVPFALLVSNPSREPLTLYLRGRTPTVEVIIAQGRTVVWRRLAGQVIPAIVQVLTIAPRDTLRIDVPWNGRPARGTIRPGRYTVRAELLTDAPEPLRAGPVVLAVVAG